jgi:putative FmdB family regulatory protein
LPVYEYACSKGHNYEKTEGFDAPSQQKCITCGAPARRQISLPAVIFKGSGFYSTDNRKSGSGHNGGSAKSDSATSGDNGGPSQDATPAPAASEPKVEAAKAD